jgi:hypothetical protein
MKVLFYLVCLLLSLPNLVVGLPLTILDRTFAIFRFHSFRRHDAKILVAATPIY